MSAFLSFLLSPALQAVLLPLKVLFLAIGIFLLGIVLFVLLTTRWWKLAFWYDIVEFLTKRTAGTMRAERVWRRILRRRDEFTTSREYLKALRSGDALLEKIIARVVPHWEATTTWERLNLLGPATVPNIEELKWAHAYAHELLYTRQECSLEEGARLLDVYTEALRALGVSLPR